MGGRAKRAAVLLVAGSVTGAVATAHHPKTRYKPVHAMAAAEPVVIDAHAFAAEKREASPLTTLASTSTTQVAEVRPTAPVAASTGGRDLGLFLASAYCLRGHTASGTEAGPGSVAVDPAVVPLGTRLEVPGYGAAVADDTGGAIKGHRLDLWFASCAAADEWGMRWVEVAAA